MAGELELERLIVRLLGDSTGYETMLRSAQQDARTAATAIKHEATQIEGIAKSLRVFGQSIQGIGRTIRSTGKYMSMAITAPLVGMGALATRESTQFETALQRLQSLVGLSSDQTQEFRKQVLELSATVGQTPTQLTAAYEAITSGGLRGKKAFDALTIAAKASSIGMGDVATVGRTASLAMEAYKASGLDAAEATEVLRAAAEAGNASAAQFAPVMGRLLPTAQNLGLEFHEVAGAIAYMTRSTGDASQAATGLAGMMSKIQGAGLREDIKKALGAQGLKDIQKVFADQGLQAGLQKIQTFLEGKGFSLLDFFSDREAFNAALMMTGAGAKDLGDIIDSVANSAGKIDEKFSAWSETMGAKMARSMAGFSSMLIKMGDIVAPIMEQLTQWGMDIMDVWGNLSPEFQKIAVKVAAVAAAAGPVVIAFGTILTLIGGAASAIAGAITFITGGGGLIASLLLIPPALAAALFYLTSEDGFIGIWEKVKAAVMNFSQFMQGFLANFTVNWQELRVWLYFNWDSLWKDMINLLIAVGKNMLDNLIVVQETYIRLWTAAIGWLSNQLKALWDRLPSLAIDGLEKLVGMWYSAGERMMDIFLHPEKAMIGGASEWAKQMRKQFVNDFTGGMEDPMQQVRTILQEQLGKLKLFEGFDPQTELPEFTLTVQEAVESVQETISKLPAALPEEIPGPDMIIPVKYEKVTATSAMGAEALSRVAEYESLRPVVVNTNIKTPAQDQLAEAKRSNVHLAKTVELLNKIANPANIILQAAGLKT